MTDQKHPITPPLALINQWWDEAKQNAKYGEPIVPLVVIRAAQWGADQELKACCEWLGDIAYRQSLHLNGSHLRAARRPKPPSLKEQALKALERQSLRSISSLVSNNDCDTIRRALEQLDD